MIIGGILICILITETLIIGRIIQGFSMGLYFTSSGVYIKESVPGLIAICMLSG